MATPLAHDDYTVGWVCALPKERTAATAMLDQRHPDLSTHRDDTNVYTLGSIGAHNIVIACLPRGITGNNPAVAVVVQMIRSFPAIRVGLMVGIGGGIPPVRLGDVVVSVPSGEHPGLVQWDRGKTEVGGFRRTGALNNPPTPLLGALTKLHTDHEMIGTRIPEFLDELGRKWPKLAGKYLKSASLKDVLFKPEYNHVLAGTENYGGEETEGECALCDKAQTISRPDRQEDPTIHYGVIASGNQVIKNAVYRDELCKNLGGNILCIEMEAAGLMNTFPCMVIRGISDYADSHKNDSWQEYAAAVAAAFAKELLGYVQPADIENEKKVEDVLNSVSSKVIEIERHVLHTRAQIDRARDLKMLDFLTTVTYEAQQNDLLRKRQPGTGKWLLDSPTFQNWLSGSEKALLCSGIPGAGKTFMTSIVVDYLQRTPEDKTSRNVAYIYFSFQRRHEQHLESLLCGVLRHLAGNQLTMPIPLLKLYEQYKDKRTRPTLKEITDTLQDVTATLPDLYIIIDAIDECETSQNCRSKFISEMFKLRSTTQVKIFVTSRDIPGIKQQFTVDCLFMNISAADQDVHAFLEDSMSALQPSIQNIIEQTSHLRQDIKHIITGASKGMFLLAKLYMESVTDSTCEADLLNAFERIKGRSDGMHGLDLLEQAFIDTMRRITGQTPNHRLLAIRALTWLALSKRPMEVPELQHALAIGYGDKVLDKSKIRDINVIISSCGGFLSTNEDTNMISVVHNTIQEFLIKTKDRWLPEAERYIGSSCLSYLSFQTFEDGKTKTDSGFEHRLREHPMYHYAAQYWGEYARAAADLHGQSMDLLQSPSKLEAFSQALLAVKRWPNDRNYSQRLPQTFDALHVAAYFGMDTCVKLLLDNNPADSDKSCDMEALWWALKNKHIPVMQELLSRVTAPSKTTRYANAMFNGSQMSAHGHVIQLVFETDPDLVDDFVKWLGSEYERTHLLHELRDIVIITRNLKDHYLNDGDKEVFWLQRTGYWLGKTYSRTGAMSDLEGAIEAVRQSIQRTIEGSLHWSQGMEALGSLLGDKYQRSGKADDLKASVNAIQRAVSAVPRNHPDLPKWQNALGFQLGRKYLMTGNEQCLDEAIAVIEQAINMVPLDNPDLDQWRQNLTIQRNHRFARQGAEEYLEDSVNQAREALDSATGDPLQRAQYLEQLGNLLGTWFSKTGVNAYLEEAIALIREALEVTETSNVNRTRYLNSLSTQLGRRFTAMGQRSDLNEAISNMELATCDVPANHPEQAAYLSTLGNLLSSKYFTYGVQEDLELALDTTARAASSTPPDHPDRAQRLQAQAELHERRYETLGDLSDIQAAKRCSFSSLHQETAPVSVRVDAGRWLLASAYVFQDIEAAFGCAKLTIELIPNLAHRSLSIIEKERLLQKVDGVASNAAAIAIEAGASSITAIQWLEMGRGVLANSLQESHIDLTDLRQRHPELAHAFSRLQSQLEGKHESKISPRSTAATRPDTGLRQNAVVQYEELIAEIRSQPGFSQFLLTPSQNDIVGAAKDGPIVILNGSTHRVDALIVQNDGVSLLELPENLSSVPIGSYDTLHIDSYDTLNRLWDSIVKPVLDFLGYLELPVNGEWPHVWWIPNGTLESLPFHAAGYHYDRDKKNRSALDRVVSSYASSISRMLYIRSQPRLTPGSRGGQLSAFGKTAVSKMSPLPFISSEIATVKRSAEKMGMKITEPGYNKTSFMSELEGCSILHFAGHGVQHSSSPLQSTLILEDWEEDPLTLISIIKRGPRVEPGFLAYLSACASSRSRPSNESLSLISIFQLAGFRHVIAALHSVNDVGCKNLADLVYKSLANGDLTQDISVSSALHHSMRTLRDLDIKQSEALQEDWDGEVTGPLRDIVLSELDDFTLGVWVMFGHFGI